MKIMIKELPKYEVAFVRRTGSYFEPQDHWGKLLHWANERGLFPPDQSFIGLSLDNPDVVESHHCRHDACVTIPEGFPKESHPTMRFKTLDGGKYVLYPFYDQPDKLNIAYKYMFEQWLPCSEYEADDNRYNLEFTMNNPWEDAEGKLKVDLLIPIKKRTS
ncbi:GyrI-like domain-containing protein [Bacillus sp. CGMCC 1.16541]|uniref:AraC family transcriptional regulator n=1 Tax=Bacillus sp. CGMCC 1.16541 TaxID=2185143 RepID=UPI000D737721|nr:GyrI-like domain-containing protein [Bacillus sp. CGMCC 1.16541]